MVHHLFKGFLTDAAEYEAAQARWRRLWDRIVAEEKREADWQVPWFAPEFANGTPMRDGNPIFSAISPTLRRGVRIIQHQPTSDELELEYWLDTFQGEEPIGELVISCALSEQGEKKAAELIRAWVTTGCVSENSTAAETKCANCGCSIVPLRTPHVVRKCQECEKTTYVCEPGGNGGIQVRPGDVLTFPPGSILLSLDPNKASGKFSRVGVAWYVQNLLFFRGHVNAPEKFESTLDTYATDADQVLSTSDLLKHLNPQDEAQAREAVKIVTENQDKPEWWASCVTALAREVKRAIEANDARRAAWLTNWLDCCRSMLIYQEELERIIWPGYTARRLREILQIWKNNEGNASEEFWQRTIAENAVVISQLFSFPVVIFGGKSFVGGTRVDNKGGKLVDFLFKNQLTASTALLEIKTPLTHLLGSEYRDAVFPPSRELAGAITQVLTYKDTLTKGHSNLLEDSSYSESARPFHTFDPQCLLIAGNFQQEIGTNKAKHRSFDLFRNSLRKVEVITYDEVFTKVEHLLTLLGVEGTKEPEERKSP